MINTSKELLNRYSNYVNSYNKIKRLVSKQELTPIIRGLYEDDHNVDGYLLANAIYGPSYLSFDFALSYYGLIPERVYTYTSATCLKRKTKRYSNHFGNYTYQDVPTAVFSLGILIKEEKGYTYLIASKEKALCDKLYSLKPVGSQKELKALLFEDLRIDEIEFAKLNIEDIRILSEKYNSKNVTTLYKLMKGMGYEHVN